MSNDSNGDRRAPVSNWTTDYDILDPTTWPTRTRCGTTCASSARSPTLIVGAGRGCPRPTPTCSVSRRITPTSPRATWACSPSPTRNDRRHRWRSRCHRSTRTSPSTPGLGGCCCRGSRTAASPQYEPYTKDLCNSLIDGFIEQGSADAAGDYARQIPVRVISLLLGVPDEMADTFTGWVQDFLEFAHDEARATPGATPWSCTSLDDSKSVVPTRETT